MFKTSLDSPLSDKQALDNPINDEPPVDFTRVKWFAERALAAYKTEPDIRANYPDTVRVAITQRNVQYFLETDDSLGQQVLTIRGTANFANVKADADYIESRNKALNVYVHSGFDCDAMQLLGDVHPYLDKSMTLVITGHSLGAAIATLLMMYLHEEGFTIAPAMNFGQPKLTNKAGAEKYSFLPLVRVVDEDDIVPLLPPDDLIDEFHGGYEHFGAEILLLNGVYFVYEDKHQARQLSAGSFWTSLGHESVSDHYMMHYLQHILAKLETAQKVAYANRDLYLGKHTGG